MPLRTLAAALFRAPAVPPARIAAATKASATGPLIALHRTGAPVWSPRDYAAFAREGYARNPIVYRAVRMVAEAAASIPVHLFEGQHRLDAHPLLDLLAAPNAECCGPDLFEDWYGYLLIAGNAYMEAVSIGGAIRELHVLRPDRMKVIAGGDGWPDAYEYTANGASVRFGRSPDGVPRPILHMALFNPSNDYYGMSPIEAASSAIDLHNAASGWNKALLDNAARPSGALVYGGADGHLTEEQFARLKAELESNYQGAMNAGRPLLLEGGLDWKPMSLTPKDMDFLEAKHASAREIALALGVPPMLLGIPGDNTYANYQEANRVFWRQTVLPLAARTLKAIGGWLAPSFGEALTLRPALDEVEALSAERAALWDRVQRADFLTVDEKRAAVGLPPIEAGGV
jgi:HK97 family phage portal protein